VLEVASVAGAVFDAPAVAAGLGSAPERVEAICHQLCRTQRWLQHLGNREWPDGALAVRYSFRHGLYQRTLYDGLSPTRRAALHEQDRPPSRGRVRRPDRRSLERAGQALPGESRPAARARLPRSSGDAGVRPARLPRQRRLPRASASAAGGGARHTGPRPNRAPHATPVHHPAVPDPPGMPPTACAKTSRGHSVSPRGLGRSRHASTRWQRSACCTRMRVSWSLPRRWVDSCRSSSSARPCPLRSRAPF
jgi:hypothetical protein